MSESIETDFQGSDDESEVERESLVAQLEILRVENQRLREEVARVQRNRYRRTAIGLAMLGLTGLGGAILFPSVRNVLIVLGSIGLFSGLLTFWLTPERFVPEVLSERVYSSLIRSRESLIGELGLSDERVYLPEDGGLTARLFIPQFKDWRPPESQDLKSVLVLPEDPRERGLSFEPTGQGLYEEFRRMQDRQIPGHPVDLGRLLLDAITEGFEIARRGSIDVDPNAGRLSLRVQGHIHAPLDRLDNPIISLFGVALATGLDSAITVVDVDDDGDAGTVSFRWEPE